MSCFYCVNGSVKIHASESSQELLEELKEELGEIEWETDLQNQIVTFSIHGGMGCLYSTAENIEDLLRQIGEHAVEPACFTTKCDDEETELWIGKDPELSKAVRNDIVSKARLALKELTVEEAELLLEETQNPDFWRK